MMIHNRIKRKYGGRDRAISTVMIRRTITLLTGFLIVILAIMFFFQTNSLIRENKRMLSHVLDNLDEAITGYVDMALITNADIVLEYGAREDDKPLLELKETDITDIDGDGIISIPDINAYLNEIKKSLYLVEISVIDPDGIIIYSSNDNYIGYNMTKTKAGNNQALDFYENTKREGFYIQEELERTSDNIITKYVGIELKKDCWLALKGSILQIGWTQEQVDSTRLEMACVFVENVSIGTYGSYLVLDSESEIDGSYKLCGEKGMMSSRSMLNLTKDKYVSFPAATQKPREMFTYDYEGTTYYCMYDKENDFIYAAMIPKSEAFNKLNNTRIQLLISILVAFSLMGIMMLVMIREEIIRPVRRMTDRLTEISDGNFDVRMDVTDNEEFSMLSDDINIMVLRLKKYIKEADARIDKELALAKAIQKSSLPHLFPPYPDRKEFSIFASMDTAKDVGGDYYDFFFTDNDHLALVIADVSNKGIPAAMFMMQVKEAIRGRAVQGGRPSEILTDVNNSLCKGNDEKMFVTLWIAIVEISTGNVLEANAGHEHPALYRNGSYRLVKYPHLPPLAVLPNISYIDRQFVLESGDKLFVYTDGVTEAKNEDGVMFGEDRLVDVLNNCCDAGCEETIQKIKREIDDFVKDAKQFDDITMCSFSYYGQHDM